MLMGSRCFDCCRLILAWALRRFYTIYEDWSTLKRLCVKLIIIRKMFLLREPYCFSRSRRRTEGSHEALCRERTKEGLLVVWLQSSSFRGNQREGKHQKIARWIDLTRMGMKSKDINMHGSNIILLKIIPRWPLVLTTCYYFSWSVYYADQILVNF